jgi:hypothetical protein
MQESTPYRTRPEWERHREAECLRRLFEVAAPVELVLEPLGGLGDAATIAKLRGTLATELDRPTAAARTKHLRRLERASTTRTTPTPSSWTGPG